MGNPERSNKALKRKKTVQKVMAITSVVLLILVAAIILTRKNVQSRYGNRNKAKVETVEVTTGSIRTTVSASGALTSEDVEEIKVPLSVTVDETLVEQGERIEAGTLLAKVDTNTVLTTMSDIQTQLASLDKKLVSASNDKVSSTIKAGVGGRLKAIFAKPGDAVADVMYEHGAVAMLSLDNYMAVDLEGTGYQKGDEVTVVTSDGKSYPGKVDVVKDGIATILITDNGPLYDDTVQVDGKFSGNLYIHKPLKVTGYAGTILNVSAMENSPLTSSQAIYGLTDTDYTANYDKLLQERADYEELYQKLVKMYLDGGVVSPIAGTVETIVDPDEAGNITASASASASSTISASATATSATVTSKVTGYSTVSMPATSTGSLLDETLLAAIDPDKTMSITIAVDETDILSLSVGQEAAITVDSIGEDTYTGKITEVNTIGTASTNQIMTLTGTTSTGVTTYTAKILLDKAPYMLSGMTADVNITVEGVENAMLLPFDAVHRTSAMAYVYTTYDQETDTLGGIKEVTIGINNGKMTEIISGLNPGDTIYYTPKEQTFSFGGLTITTGGSRSSRNSGGGMGHPAGIPRG